MYKLYHHNHLPENNTIKNYAPGSRHKELHSWGGARTRRLLGAAYTLAFLCLLRFDEVLKIEIDHIERVSETEIKLTLPFRKTHQFGGESSCYI